MARCDRCPHLLAHHGANGCEHTPGHNDPYADPATYAGQARDCTCDRPAGKERNDSPTT